MHIYRVRPTGFSSSGDFALRRDGAFHRITTPFAQWSERLSSGHRLEVGEPLGPEGAVELLAPAMPTKIVCIGLNYLHHAEEQGKAVPDEPLMFMKPTTALQHPGAPIELPPQSELVHHEGELAVVIGRPLKRASADEAAAGVAGYTCANDVSARDIQRRENRYTRAKGFDTFCPLGPVLVTADSWQPDDHRIALRVNGDERQSSRLDDFIFDVPTVVSFVSHVMTLLPGDVVLTGTPAGVGPLADGDTVEVEIDGIGVLENPVVRVE